MYTVYGQKNPMPNLKMCINPNENGFHGDIMGCTEKSGCKIWGYIYIYIIIHKHITAVLITNNGDIPIGIY